MDAGLKEHPAKCEQPKFLGKAGWVKRATGRLFASYKDHYIHVEKTEVVVYENKDLQNCLERIDLENYDKCQEFKSPFKKKHRLILIPSPKSANKAHDVKFQAQNSDEKEAWISALSDAINRAKNKVFDEVKTDESCSLEHVTRTRPKGNRNRRPPTRIHMQQVASMSSDGVLQPLDLDTDREDSLMHNGTLHPSGDGTETPEDAIQVQTRQSKASEVTESGPAAGEGAQGEPEVEPHKRARAAPEDEPDRTDGCRKKVLKPPVPPPKEAKPSITSAEEATEKAVAEALCPDPPNKRRSSTSGSNPAEASRSNPNPPPPPPPPKDQKPSHPAVEPEREDKAMTGEVEDALPAVRHDEPEGPRAGGSSFEESVEGRSTNGSSDHKPQTPTEPSGMSPGPPSPEENAETCAPPDTHHTEDKEPEPQSPEGQKPDALLQAASERGRTGSHVPPGVVLSQDPVSDDLRRSPLPCLSHGDKTRKGEEKSVDSGQHSDEDGEDTPGASTAALRGSPTGLDGLDDSHTSVHLRKTPAMRKSHVRSEVFPCQHSPHLKPSSKARSASSGDLLSDSPAGLQDRKKTTDDGAPRDEAIKLERELSLEIEETSELLRRASKAPGAASGESRPESLLAEALEKLRRADRVLKEAKRLKRAGNSGSRKSW